MRSTHDLHPESKYPPGHWRTTRAERTAEPPVPVKAVGSAGWHGYTVTRDRTLPATNDCTAERFERTMYSL